VQLPILKYKEKERNELKKKKENKKKGKKKLPLGGLVIIFCCISKQFPSTTICSKINSASNSASFTLIHFKNKHKQKQT